MLHHVAIDLKLQALRNIGRPWRECGVEEDAAIAVAYAFEPERKLEILIRFLRLKVAVVFVKPFPMYQAVFNCPAFFTDLHPPVEIITVEQLDPILSG